MPDVRALTVRLLRLLLTILTLASLKAHAAVTFDSADFEIVLGSDWTRTALIGVDHYYFQSKRHDASVKIDAVRDARIRSDNLERAARALIQTGIKHESDENRAGSVTITDQAISRTSNGVRATYAGRDTKRSFRFVGFLQEGKAVYLLFETPLTHQDRLKSVV